MSQDHDSDFTDDGQGPEESAVLKDLRSRLRAAEKEREELRKQQAEAEARAQSARAEAARETVNTLGYEGLVEDVLNWVEGDITQEKVIEALQARSIPLPDAVERPTPGDQQTANPSEIGQHVADAAAGGAVKSLDERLAEAQTGAEVQAIMEEAGLTRSHS